MIYKLIIFIVLKSLILEGVLYKEVNKEVIYKNIK